MATDFVAGNALQLLECGAEYFPALARAIDAAEREVHLETYIFEDDETGRLIAGALCGAARRGACVRVLVDGFGGGDFPDTLMPLLLDAGVEVLIYRPEAARFSFKRHRLRRLHRKLVVIDARVAFVGGINIIDDMHTPRHTPPRYDYAVRVEGPLLAAIHGSVTRLWELVSWANFRHRYRAPSTVAPSSEARGTVHAAFTIRDNLRHRRDIEDAYLAAIAAARREVLIASAYFLPGRRFRHALMDAARRGVTVTILLQGRVEYVLLHFATKALYGALLARGIRIVEYRRGFLHAKVAVIDRHWATVGSSNIDPFSLLLAREANVVVRDAAFAAGLLTRLEAAMESGAVELQREHWRRRPWYHRAATWTAYTLVRLAIGLAGYARQH
jgi:cardiolipin synthase